MSRTVAARALGILLAGAATRAAGDGPPPLTPPTLAPPALAAPSEAAKPAAPPVPTRIPESRPVLAIPGVTAPGRLRTQPQPITPSATDLGAPRELPDFDIPKEMLEPTPRVASPAGAPPTVIESVPSGSAADTAPSLSPRPYGASRSSPGRSEPRSNATPPPAPDSTRRPQGLFGRFFPPPFQSPRTTPDDRPTVTVEPRTDPAADAALQRRIERQVRETLGDRVRSYEVRVVDRNVTVRVRASRFWQKRSVRHTLETLPALSGYHARVDVVD
ncbi:MAG: hypothetical protein P4L84_26220 [Isosphaeraceae bacterium]|nr:hypothetical protein [Isosphaeraceae bacterium]